MTLGATQTLGGSGSVNGSLIGVAGSTLAPGGLFSVGTLTVNNNVTLTGTGGDTINYNAGNVLGVGVSDLLSVGGTLTLPTSGQTTINFVPTSTTPAGTYTVANAGTLVGLAANLTATTSSRYTVGTPAISGNSITLDISGSNSSLTWAGATGNSAWDVKTTSPWTGGAGGDNMFWQSDDVTFDDTATSQAVSIGTGVAVMPMSVTVNGTKSYTISGAGKISGSTGLTVNSTGTTILGTTNDYTGTTSVTAGTLSITGSIGPYSPMSITGGTVKLNANDLGLGDNTQFLTAPTTINGGTLDLNARSVGNELVSVQGAGVGGNGAIINTGAANTNAVHYLTLNDNTTIGGTGRWDIGRYTGPAGAAYIAGNGFTLTKTGTNNIVLINLGYTNLGGVVINQGDLTVQGDNIALSTILGSTTTLAPITINAGGQLSMWGSNTSLANNVTLNGGGIGGSLNDSGALTYACPINLTSSSYIYTVAPGTNQNTTTTFTNAITGTGSLTKPATVVLGGVSSNNTGVTVFSGATSNTYVGATNMYAGTLNLQKTGGAIAIPGNLNIGDAGTTGWDVVNLGASEQIANTGVVTFNGAVNNYAYLNLMGFDETVGGIIDASTNGIVQIQDTNNTINTNSTFTVNTATGTSYSFNGRFRDKYAGTGTGKLNLVKDGPGTQTLTGTNILYTGNTTVLGGKLDIPVLNTPSSIVTVAAGSNELLASALIADKLDIGAGGLVVIKAVADGPLSAGGLLDRGS